MVFGINDKTAQPVDISNEGAHRIIQYFGNGGMTNASLRQRFGMHDKQASQVSRLIKQAVELGRIKFKDPANVSTKFNTYVPYWA